MLAELATGSNDAAPLVDDVENVRILQDLQTAGALGDGKAHVVSLRAVREALGPRWGERKATIWEMAESQIRRRLGEQGLVSRLTDDAFLILTPALGSNVARVLAVRVLKDLLTHFLGALETHDIDVMVATGFDGGRLQCRALSGDDLSQALASGDKREREHESSGLIGAHTDRGAPPHPQTGGSLTTLQGRRLRFSVSVEPIIDLARGAVAGHRVEPKITFEHSTNPLPPSARSELLPRDVQEGDLAALRRALARLGDGQSSVERPSLILAMSYLTLSNTRARARLLGEAAQRRAEMTRSVIWEIADLDPGVPVDHLKEDVALLKPFCRSVFARVDKNSLRAFHGQELGLAGFVFQSNGPGTSRDDEASWLLAVSRTFKGGMGTLIAASLTTTLLLPIAGAAGFTHATVRTQSS
ncbi:hypothetical protein [Caulobacter sp. S45]|uniref:hypothetical protein n=1 Tax=Caulobacter sp. S45 TaxID=1641861 RepID=UPI00131DFB55|nr:hypothetical protein [Caulobacter sp. S45]